VVTDLRETLYELRATVTEDADLSDVAARSLERLAERTGMTIDWHAHVDRRLPHQVEQEVWRILQEALNNIERHAGASTVKVRWTVEGHRARLLVEDDGRGFSPNEVEGEHYGLLGMRERADAISAQLTIDSIPGQGTRLLVEVPR
jgi:signal transduction histidine kinase